MGGREGERETVAGREVGTGTEVRWGGRDERRDRLRQPPRSELLAGAEWQSAITWG